LSRLVKVSDTGQVVYQAEKQACRAFPDPKGDGTSYQYQSILVGHPTINELSSPVLSVHRYSRTKAAGQHTNLIFT